MDAPAAIVGRFAPSPTGALHIGSLVTAVGSWLLARSQGGSWLLRLDDLDTPRQVSGMADDIQRTLERFRLFWDGEIFWQSRHLEFYQQAFEHLHSNQRIYPCYCSRKEILQSASAPHGDEETVKYPGSCRDVIKNNNPIRSWRLRVLDEDICFDDLCAGRLCQNLSHTCGDIAIKRGDGSFAYQLAVVVDDHIAGVNQVVRGRDLLNSTPRQIHLQQMLGIPQPDYAHLPLVTNRDGSKLSKRDNLVSDRLPSWRGTESLLLVKIMHFLGMIVPKELLGADCGELLQWGISSVDFDRIPKKGGFLECGQE